LPNNTTMETRSFNIIEDRIGPSLQTIVEEVLLESLTEEVRLSMEALDDFDVNEFNNWTDALDGTLVLAKNKYPAVMASFDMAWQQRNSGNRYNSPLGHGLLVGARTTKPIAFILKSKYCNLCSTWNRKETNDGIPPLLHECCKNHDGSSSSMEPLACLEMVTDLYQNKFVIVSAICIDDDASTRSMLKWSTADYMKNTNMTTVPKIPIFQGVNKGKLQDRPDRGRLPAEVPEPLFLADPNHRRKMLTGELITVTNSRVSEKATMTRMDSTRIGKGYSYMIRQLQHLPEDKYCDASKAVLDHHFEDHRLCGAWCPRKRLTEEQGKASAAFYRCKTKDAKLNSILSEKIMCRFR
jgi:hypothetical protein